MCEEAIQYFETGGVSGAGGVGRAGGAGGAGGGTPAKKKAKPANDLKKVYWDTVGPAQINNTIWGTPRMKRARAASVASQQRRDEEEGDGDARKTDVDGDGEDEAEDGAMLETGDISILRTLFSKKKAKIKSSKTEGSSASTPLGDKKGGASDGGGPVKKVNLLDGKRSNNIAIGLAQFKAVLKAAPKAALGADQSEGGGARRYKYTPLVESVDRACTKTLTLNRLQTLCSILPTTQEMDTVRQHVTKGGEENITSALATVGEAEHFFWAASHSDRFVDKVKFLLLRETFSGRLTEVRDDAAELGGAARRVQQSEPLEVLLGAILSIGNVLNAGTRQGGAEGIKVDSLLKVQTIKSADGKTSLLEFAAGVVQAKHAAEVEQLEESLGDLHAGARLDGKTITADFGMLERELARTQRLFGSGSGSGSGSGKGASLEEAAFSRLAQSFLEEAEGQFATAKEALVMMGEQCSALVTFFAEDAR